MLLIGGLFIISAVDASSHVDLLVLFSTCLVGVRSPLCEEHVTIWFSMASYLLFLTLLLVCCTL